MVSDKTPRDCGRGGEPFVVSSACLTGAVLTWARALGEFGATIIFAGNFPGRTQTMPLAIYIGFEIELDVALTLSVILMAISFLVLLLVKRFFATAGTHE